MDGIFFDFEDNDIVIKDDGTFVKAGIGSQNCALIATSQLCRLTQPQVGEQLAVKLLNRKNQNLSKDINNAIKAVQKDGGKNVQIYINEDNNLVFNADYDS